jgi:hypothetical protein
MKNNTQPTTSPVQVCSQAMLCRKPSFIVYRATCCRYETCVWASRKQKSAPIQVGALHGKELAGGLAAFLYALMNKDEREREKVKPFLVFFDHGAGDQKL